MRSKLPKLQNLNICPHLTTRSVCRNTGARVVPQVSSQNCLSTHLSTRAVCRNTGARVKPLFFFPKTSFQPSFDTARVHAHGCPCEPSSLALSASFFAQECPKFLSLSWINLANNKLTTNA